MTFITCTERHAAAVVDGTVRDARDLGDRWEHPTDGRLTELWVACDDPTREAIQDILGKVPGGAPLRRRTDPGEKMANALNRTYNREKHEGGKMTNQIGQEGQEPKATQEEQSRYSQKFPEIDEKIKRRKYV